jgi:glutathionyl-hydroquinone reductase
MGMLVNGVWQDQDRPLTGGDGAFVRPESGLRDRITRDGSSGFKAEAGRYYLITAPSCPWAHRYTREIYQMPGVAETVDLPGIKLGYYGGMRHLNPSGIIPLGPELDFSAPHNRGKFAKAA